VGTRKAVGQASGGFTGTIVVVSHGRHFVSDLATRVVELRPGRVLRFGGSYEERLEKHGQGYPPK
jgi:ATPase subunit of ABC transporter with duplicated ATPase domains